MLKLLFNRPKIFSFSPKIGLVFIILVLIIVVNIQQHVWNNLTTQDKVKKPILFNVVDKMTATEYEQVKNQLVNTVNTKDPKVALATLESLTNIDPKVIQYCHGLTHEIGHAAYKKYGFVESLLYQDSSCGSGYVHGIIESYFSSTTDLTTKRCAKIFHGD